MRIGSGAETCIYCGEVAVAPAVEGMKLWRGENGKLGGRCAGSHSSGSGRGCRYLRADARAYRRILAGPRETGDILAEVSGQVLAHDVGWMSAGEHAVRARNGDWRPLAETKRKAKK